MNKEFTICMVHGTEKWYVSTRHGNELIRRLICGSDQEAIGELLAQVQASLDGAFVVQVDIRVEV